MKIARIAEVIHAESADEENETKEGDEKLLVGLEPPNEDNQEKSKEEKHTGNCQGLEFLIGPCTESFHYHNRNRDYAKVLNKKIKEGK